jgi:hypothetical protein
MEKYYTTLPILKKNNKNKISSNDFFIVNPDDYEYLLRYNYKVPQLKEMCKHYKLKIIGNKQTLLNHLYNYLKLSTFAISIQKLIRKFIVRNCITKQGPGLFNRKICINETDFLSFEKITDIPYYQFISCKDSDGKIYGFDICSLYQLIKKQKSFVNPYNRNKLDNSIYNNLMVIFKLYKMYNCPVQISLEEEINVDSNKQFEFRLINLFQIFDSLGNYTNISWFQDLNKNQIIIFMKSLYDIWNYRAQLSHEVKCSICPPNGNPFHNYTIGMNLYNISFDTIRRLAVNTMENLVKPCVDDEQRKLGAIFCLGALSLINFQVAEALPWLYESFHHT